MINLYMSKINTKPKKVFLMIPNNHSIKIILINILIYYLIKTKSKIKIFNLSIS